MTKQKKAQLQMGESILVLIIFFIILTIGAIFYAKISIESGKQNLQDTQTINSIKTAQEMAKMPELVCTRDGLDDFDCLDVYKYKAFSQVANLHKQYYDALFPNTRASVQSIYPTNEPSLVILDTTLKDQQTGKIVANNRQNFFIPVTLYNAVTDQSSFGYLQVEVFS